MPGKPQVCDNSGQGTENIDSDVDSNPENSARSAALFLWGMHNRVNVRLAPQWGQDVTAVVYPTVQVRPNA